MTTTLQNTIKRLDRKAAQHLCNAWLDSRYELERTTDFWSQRDSSDCLAGERKLFGSDLVCSPLRFTGKALLVYYVDTTGKAWFAWIHS